MMNYLLTKISVLSVLLSTICLNLAYANNLLHQADSLYVQQNYNEALNRYRMLLESDQFLKQDFTINFKIGICYLKNGNYTEAEKTFLTLSNNSSQIPEYVDYYYFMSTYQTAKSWLVITRAQRYLTDYNGHFLADSIHLCLADYEFMIKRFKDAYKDYTRLAGRKSMKTLRPYLLSKMAFCKWYSNQKVDALEQMYQVMKKYPVDPDALKIADLFLSYKVPSSKYEFAIAAVYLKHRRFEQLSRRLETFIQQTENQSDIEKARYYLVQIYYEKEKYRTALYGFNNLLTNLKNKSFESRIRLSIARCYLRLGDKEQAVQVYMDYAKRFPRRRMAVESMWKASWIYEEQGQLSAELEVHRQILRHWPRSAYRNEARFRIGLCLFRLGRLDEAERIFSEIKNSRLPDFHRTRSTYWLAKTYDLNNRPDQSKELYRRLATDLFKSYYSLKSYILFENEIDSLHNFQEQLADTKNPLRFYTDTMAPLMDQFEPLFLIRELLGEDMALQELSEQKYYPKTLKGWISLAEIYKKLGAYNQAFRIYDYIDNKHFADLSKLEKPFLLKESYPLYYNNIIGNYQNLRGLDNNLVLAIIRAESGFNRQAHSWANAYGLMQIIPETAGELAGQLNVTYSSPNDLFNPDLNINLGTFYLKQLMDQFDNQPELALAGYNAGPHRVRRWTTFPNSDDIDFFVENIEYSQTRNYVRKVMSSYWIYSLLDKVN